MSKIRDGASMQREINRANTESRYRAYIEASKAIRDKLAYEREKAYERTRKVK